MTSISPSDIIHGAVVTHLVIAARNGLQQPCSPLLVLCYLSDHITTAGAAQFATFQEMSLAFNETVQQTDSLRGIRADFCVGTVDEFISKFETLRAAIESNNQISHNNLAAPSMVTPDSHLGVYLRTILSKWECLHFEDLCSLHLQMQRFFSAEAMADANINQTELSVDRFSPFLRMWSGTAYNDSPTCEGSTSSGDVAVIESEVHSVYDLSGVSTHMTKSCAFPEAKDGANGNANTKAALEALVFCNSTTTATTLKHQHAMLRLAAMWIQVNNLAMALSAVEEALKTAHQRGDHRTVSHALLLLYSVFQHSQDPELVASAEDILMRCTQRSAALDLQHLTAQSALLLASIRSKQPLRCGLKSAARASRDASASDQPLWHFKEVWSQMAFALLGEIALTRQVVTSAGIAEDSEFTQSGPSTSLLPTANQSAAKKGNLQEVPLAVGPELLQLTLQSYHDACDLWERQGMLHMAEFTCRRGLAQLAHIGTAHDILPLYVHLLYLQTDIMRLSEAHQSVDRTLIVAKNIKTILSGTSDTLMPQLDGAMLYALAWGAHAQGDTSKALRLACRLVDVTAGLPSPNAPLQSHASDSNTSVATCSSKEHIRAQLLLAEILAISDVIASLQLLSDLENTCRASGNALWTCMCTYVRGRVLFQSSKNDKVAQAAALGVLREALTAGQAGGFGYVPSLVSKLMI